MMSLGEELNKIKADKNQNLLGLEVKYMNYNSIEEYKENYLKPLMDKHMKKYLQDSVKRYNKFVEKIRQDAENDFARIERGEAITEWVRG
jgi:cytochrome c553